MKCQFYVKEKFEECGKPAAYKIRTLSIIKGRRI